MPSRWPATTKDADTPPAIAQMYRILSLIEDWNMHREIRPVTHYHRPEAMLRPHRHYTSWGDMFATNILSYFISASDPLNVPTIYTPFTIFSYAPSIRQQCVSLSTYSTPIPTVYFLVTPTAPPCIPATTQSVPSSLLSSPPFTYGFKTPLTKAAEEQAGRSHYY